MLLPPKYHGHTPLANAGSIFLGRVEGRKGEREERREGEGKGGRKGERA